MLAVRLPKDLEDRLNKLAASTHRSKSFYMKEALESYLEEYEKDLKIIAKYEEEVKNGTLKTYSLEEVMKELNIGPEELEA